MIFLLRHCEKTAEAASAPLSANGFAQAKNIVSTLQKLGIKRILSSPYARAQQSVAPFAKASGLAVSHTNALAEWRLSGKMRDDWKEVLARGLADPSTKVAGGERAADVWARAQAVLKPSKPTLLVTHGGWLTVVLGQYGRPCTLKSLLALQSPDLFSIGLQGYTQYEL